ncbi:MAG: ABC transporter permease, partial [Lachnospiraceae bacterium]|nr:ABC transporter permease [Lachnospiraceae bacterium]
MFKRLLINDFKKNKLVTLATCIFMAVSAALIGLTVLLFGSLLNSIDNLMSTAKTPDFLQMHSGEINEEELKAFALSRDETDTMQIAKFLNIENSLISIGDRSLSDSTQDNGLCIQSEYFDYLVGMDNEIIEAKKGEVYVPVCYKSEYDVTIGQTMDIGGEKLKVAGFLRDSQMNSMMASSKRFLVSNVDYEKLKDIGSEEYLIEFLMKDGSNADAFSTAYVNAGLPSNGPTITGPL